MENIGEEIIGMALPVALFLLNTNRVQKAIECCKESLFLMNCNTEENDLQSIKLLLMEFYFILFRAYRRISDYINAERYCRELLVLSHESGALLKEGNASMALAKICEIQCKFTEATQLYDKTINIRAQIGDKKGEGNACVRIGAMFYKLGEYVKAKEYYERALKITTQIGDRNGEALSYVNLGATFESLGEYLKAKEYIERALAIRIEMGDRLEEATCYGNLGVVFMGLGQYVKATGYLEKALAIRTKIGDRLGEAADYENLGHVNLLLRQYFKAKEYLQKALSIRAETGDRTGEAVDFLNLGSVFKSLGLQVEAKEYLEKALAFNNEIGNRNGQAKCYEHIGTMFMSFGEYIKAKVNLETALAIATEIGDRAGEARCYAQLGDVFTSLSENVKAKEYTERALAIRIEISDRKGVALCYKKLGMLLWWLGDYDKAKEYVERALAITARLGDRAGEASYYALLGNLFTSLGENVKAKEYTERALAIRIEISDRKGVALCYKKLGMLLWWLGDYDKAKEYVERALAITTKLGDRAGEASCYARLGDLFTSLGENFKAKEYTDRALAIRIEICDRWGVAECYGILGNIFSSLGEYFEAKEYFRNALLISIEIGDRDGEAKSYRNLGHLFTMLDHQIAEVCFEKALYLSSTIEVRYLELQVLFGYSILFLQQNKLKEALWYLHQSIYKFEEQRNLLGINDQLKISFLEARGASPYKLLSWLLCVTRNPHHALYVEELGRARGLSDLMAEKYSVETHISANPQSWSGIGDILKKENNSTCLYISFFANVVQLWIMKSSGVIYFKTIPVKEYFVLAGLAKKLSLDDILVNSFRSFGCLPMEECEDRSLQVGEPQPISLEQRSSKASRLVEEDNNEEEISSIFLCYKIFIAPIYHLLEDPEVIIVPHSSLYKVPFAALKEKDGAEYFSESHRIRIVPSLTTLKLIQDSPVDYHSNSGALIVGNPKVGWLSPLPWARIEAEMVGRLVGTAPLVGERATKQAVLEQITSVSLIHFAAHGDAERGEIALSPNQTPDNPNIIPPKEAYMLTMGDVSRVKVRAKLVVLSCCHSANGQIRAEGVIGIARAFLASGARSVLAALWAIPDSATEKLMRRFYEHLVGGESASESLHQAMKWMRNNGFTMESDWASFMLIGDDVKLEFGKQR